MATLSCHSNKAAEAIAMKTSNLIKVNTKIFSVSLNFISQIVSKKMIYYEYCFLFLTIWLQWQQAKFSNLNEFHVVG